jgi:hypothetical protein
MDVDVNIFITSGWDQLLKASTLGQEWKLREWKMQVRKTLIKLHT